jgi:hypothetical protein
MIHCWKLDGWENRSLSGHQSLLMAERPRLFGRYRRGFAFLLSLDLFHGLSTHALPRLLADGATVAPWSASTGIEPDGLKGLFAFFGLDDGCAISHLGDFSLHQGLPADTFARLFSHGVAIAPFTAATDVDRIANFQVHFVAFGSKGHTNQN